MSTHGTNRTDPARPNRPARPELAEEARQSTFRSRNLIAGAPISQVAVWAAIVAVAGTIPWIFPMQGGGGAFPMSIPVAPVVGIVLGPLAGFVACLVGGALDLIIAPYTAGIGLLSPLSIAIAAMGAGYLVRRPKPNLLIPGLLGPTFLLWLWADYAFILRDFPFPAILLVGGTDMLPSWIVGLAGAKWAARQIEANGAQAPWRLFVAVWIVCYFGVGAMQHGFEWAVWEMMFRFPPEPSIATSLAFTWWERLFVYAGIGALIGTSVILALKRMGLRRPEQARW